MNKRIYEQPTMTVVRLRHRTRILDGSNLVKGRRVNYTKSYDTWDTED